MGQRGHSEEEILRVLSKDPASETVVEVFRQRRISGQSFYLWKRKYAEPSCNSEIGGLRIRIWRKSLDPKRNQFKCAVGFSHDVLAAKEQLEVA